MITEHKFEGPEAIEKANAFSRERVRAGQEMLSFTTTADGTVKVRLQEPKKVEPRHLTH